MLDTNRFTYNKSPEEIALMQKEILKHLNALSNKEISIPSGKKSFKHSDLVFEVSQLTEDGIRFINEFYDTLEYIEEIRSRPKAIVIPNWPLYLLAIVTTALFLFIILGYFKFKAFFGIH